MDVTSKTEGHFFLLKKFGNDMSTQFYLIATHLFPVFSDS